MLRSSSCSSGASERIAILTPIPRRYSGTTETALAGQRSFRRLSAAQDDSQAIYATG